MRMIRYNDQEIELGRIFGGFAWPGERRVDGDLVYMPGYACFVGEDVRPDLTKKHNYHLYLLTEIEDSDKNRLIRKTVDQQMRWHSSFIYSTGWKDHDNMDYLDNWNARMRPAGMPELELYEVYKAGEGSIAFHIDIMKDCLNPEEPILHGIAESQYIRGYLDLIPKNYQSIKASEFPALAAMGFAVTMFRENPRTDHLPQMPKMNIEPSKSVTGY